MMSIGRVGLTCALVVLSWSSADAAAAPSPTAWPRTYAGEGGGLLAVYQPQVDAWTDRTHIEAHAAVKLERGGGTKPEYGALWIEASTRTDQAAGVVHFEDIRLTRASFPTLTVADSAQVEKAIAKGMAEAPLTLPLPAVLASLAKDEAGRKNPSLSGGAPTIFYSATPAVLVALDGKPVLAAVSGSGLRYAVNTNWNLLSDSGSGRWFLLDYESWLSAPALDGPWSTAGALPAAFTKIPEDDHWKSVRAYVPGKPMPADDVPKVFVSTKPAEIILTDGPPQMEAISDTKLLYVSNSPNDLFLDSATRSFYVLFGGRWFVASSMSGPWESAAGRLPGDFARIPSDSPRATVLVSVPGTVQSKEAALQATVPHLATVDRSEATLDVVYAGAPRFEPVVGTDLTYAVNTSFVVLSAGGAYYACSNGIWFRSVHATGPWVVAVAIPLAIYAIPPTSPLYPVTFVQVYSYTPTTVVVGYTAGYLGTYVWGGAVVFGTGYYYRPYYVPGPVPIYYPYFRTYSAAIWYNPATGAYGRGAAVYGPWGGAGAGWAYNPTTGTYARGAGAYGPYGGVGYAAAYNPSTGAWGRAETAYGPDGRTTWAQGGNPWTGTYARTQQNRTPYAQWGSSTVTRGGETTTSAHYSNASGTVGGFDSTTGARGVGYHTATGKSGGVVHGPNDTYADHNGNVYRHSDDGWQKYDDGGWQSMQRTTQVGARDGSAARQAPSAAGGESGGRDRFADSTGGTFSRLQQDSRARQTGLLGGSLAGRSFDEARGRRFGGGRGRRR